MRNERTRIEKTLGMLEDEMRRSRLDLVGRTSILKEVYLNIEVMLKEADIRDLEFRLKMQSRRMDNLEEALEKLEKGDQE